MAEKEKQKRQPFTPRIIILIVGAIIVLGIGIVALVFAIVTPLLGPLVATGDSFFISIQEGDVDEAFDMLSVTLQEEVGEQTFSENFAQYLSLESWSYSQRVDRNGLGRLEGELIDAGGKTHNFRLFLEPRDTGWAITSYDITEAP